MDTTLVPCDEPQEPPKPKDQPKGNGGSAGAVEKAGADERKGGAADYAEEDAEHKKYLFDWAEDLLNEVGCSAMTEHLGGHEWHRYRSKFDFESI
jgi:hypothetical protein